MIIKQLRQSIVKIWRWIAEGKIILLCITVIAVAFYVGFIMWHSKESIRIVGYCLQLIGMVLAINGLLNIRGYFGQPPLRSLFYDWLKRFPTRKRNVTINANATLGGTLITRARGEVWTPDNTDQPIDERITGLIKNLEYIRNEQREHANSIDELKNNHKKHKETVEKKVNKMEESMHSNLESIHTNNLIISLVGLVWLTIGITMSTMAPELYKLLY